MPLGGIGAGCICLNGYGGLQDFSIWNHPSTTALPEGYASSQAAFAILHIKGASPVTKLVEGPFPVLKIYDQGLQGEGYRRGGFEGFPRFEKCVFKGEYPFGEAKISDSVGSVAGLTRLPGILLFPLDDKNSGIPCAILEYTLHNSSPRTVEYEFSYHLSHLAPGCGEEESASRNTVIPERGVFLHNLEEAKCRRLWQRLPDRHRQPAAHQGHVAAQPGMGIRFAVGALARSFNRGHSLPMTGSNEIDTRGRNGASILLAGTLAPGESRTYPIVIAWHFPIVICKLAGSSPAC